MGRAYWQLSEFGQSAQMMERSRAQMRRLGNQSEESTAAGFAAMVLAWLGEFERALEAADHGIRLAQEIQNPFAEAANYQYRGIGREQRGDLDAAIADFAAASRTAERVGDSLRVYIVKAWEGRLRAMAGDPGRGRALIEESVAIADRIGTRFNRSQQQAFLAECLLALGELDAVPAVGRDAIRLAEEAGDKFVAALAHRTLAEAAGRGAAPEPGTAERALLEAIRLQQEIGARPELARSYASYGRLLRRGGAPDRARGYLDLAIDMFGAMGMARDLERAERARRE